MNKWFMRLGMLLLVIGLLVGCGSDANGNQNNINSSDQAEGAIVITISKNKNEEVITEKEVVIKEGAILLDVMSENFDIEEDNSFITSIDGVEQDIDAELSWIYSVNDEMAMVGASELELSVGDKVNFDLQPWE